MEQQVKLYIFTTSVVPDPYINAIAHCQVHYKRLVQVVLIGIIEDEGKTGIEENELNSLKRKINEQLENLSRGIYLSQKNNTSESVNIVIETPDRERYSTLKHLQLDISVWIYDEVEERVNELLKLQSPSLLYIFDVTAVRKRYLIDVYTILRLKGMIAIHYFELFNKPRHDHNDLIHNLVFRRTYDYVCLAESSYTRERTILEQSSIISNECINNLEDIVATYFASLWSLVYFLVGLPFLVWFCWYVLQPDVWSRVEPIVFLFTCVWFLSNYALQSLFKGRFPSFDPRESFNALKEWKRNKLAESRGKTNQKQ